MTGDGIALKNEIVSYFEDFVLLLFMILILLFPHELSHFPNLILTPPSIHRPAFSPRASTFCNPIDQPDAPARLDLKDLRLGIARSGKRLHGIRSKP